MVTAAAPRTVTVPTSALPRRSTDDLLALARYGLSEAMLATRASERYAFAHVAALRAAAAVLAQRAKPASTRRRRPASAWSLLTAVAPEFAEWAAFFAAGAAKRAAAEAGVPTAVTAREADDLMRDAETFLAVVTAALGRAHQPGLAPAEGFGGPADRNLPLKRA